jgi:hypothetical protein
MRWQRLVLIVGGLAAAAALAATAWAIAPATWEQAANAATALSLPLAVIAGIAALGSYASGKRAAADEHMHGLFREYLIARLDYDRERLSKFGLATTDHGGTEGAGGNPASVSGQIAGLKLYALEAMCDWARRQERSLAFRTPLTKMEPWLTRRDVLDSWRETIVVHLEQDKEDVLASLREYCECYSRSFLEFARDHTRLGWETIDAIIGARAAKQKSLRLKRAERRQEAMENLAAGGGAPPQP